MLGNVYWITGLSGAGKTTMGKRLFEEIKRVKDNVVFLDGDSLREVFGNNLGYTNPERRISAMRNSKICKLLSDQGIDVVCSTISMFDYCRSWNRNNIENYLEIYIKVPIDVLIKRDNKNLYSLKNKESAENVVGIDLNYEEPQNPDILLVNDGTKGINEVFNELLGEIYIKRSDFP